MAVFPVENDARGRSVTPRVMWKCDEDINNYNSTYRCAKLSGKKIGEG